MWSAHCVSQYVCGVQYAAVHMMRVYACVYARVCVCACVYVRVCMWRRVRRQRQAINSRRTDPVLGS